jgi:hypothetical protein
MREIKFRGFDNENNCWRYGYYTKLQDGIIKYNAIIYDEDGSLVRYYIHNEKSISQYTGLKDKNGKEIYEGDFDIKYGEICFWKGAFGFDLNKDDFLPLFEVWVRAELQIIGNIYENPELLKDMQNE